MSATAVPSPEALENAGAGAPPEGARAARWLLGLFAVGVPLDVLLATRFGGASVVMGGLLAAAAVWQLAFTTTLRPMPAALVWLSAYAGWTCASVAWAREVELYGIRLGTTLQLLAFVLLAWQILRSEKDVRIALAGYLVGCTYAAWNAWQTYLDEGTVYISRFRPDYFDPNDMAVTIALGVPIAVHLASGGARWARWVYLVYLPVAASAIALSGSRGGTLTFLAGVLAAGFGLALRSRLALAGMVLFVAAGVVVAQYTIPEETLARILTIREQLDGGSMGGRTVIWSAGLDLLERHPWVGVGAGGFAPSVASAVGEAIVAHNTPLSVAAELGLVGLVLFLGGFVALFWSAGRAPAAPRAFVRGLVLTWLVGTASLTWESRKATWFVLVVGAAALVASRRAEPE